MSVDFAGENPARGSHQIHGALFNKGLARGREAFSASLSFDLHVAQQFEGLSLFEAVLPSQARKISSHQVWRNPSNLASLFVLIIVHSRRCVHFFHPNFADNFFDVLLCAI